MPGRISIYLHVALALLALSTGCGDNKFLIRPARGKVVCGGQPVTVGSVSFVPIGGPGAVETGKPASGVLGPEGTFILTTKDRFDGAIVGKHKVTYLGPEGDEEDDAADDETQEDSVEDPAAAADRRQKQQAELKTVCVQKGEIVVEVKASGDNDFTIELSPPGK